MKNEIENRVMRKLVLRLIVFAGVLYFFNWLDRVNVSFAALQMNQDLHFSNSVYGLGAGVFFIAFAIFEIPSNLILHRVGARLWIARIMFTWGLVCCATAAVQGPTSFYWLRFLLGAAEAGFTPGLVLYFSLWFPARQRAKAFAFLFAFPLIAPVIGGPLSGWLLTVTNGLAGFAGWRWVFFLEGLPAVLLGVVTLFYLKDKPEDARWLTGEERDWLINTLEAERLAAPPLVHESVREFLGDGRLWALVGVYFFWSMSSYAIVFWLPLVIKSTTNLSPIEIGFANSLPFIAAIAGLNLVGRHSDRTGERKMHIIVFAIGSALCLLAAINITTAPLNLVVVCVMAFCIWGQQAVFWTLPSTYLGGRAAAGGIALVNMGAAVGGFVSAPLIGYIRDVTGSYTSVLLALSATTLMVVVIIAAMNVPRVQVPKIQTGKA